MKPVDLRNETWADVQNRLEGDRRATYDAFCRFGAQTTRDLAALMRKDAYSVGPRVTELFQLGFVRLVGRRGGRGVYAAATVAEAQAAFEFSRANADQLLLKV